MMNFIVKLCGMIQRNNNLCLLMVLVLNYQCEIVAKVPSNKLVEKNDNRFLAKKSLEIVGSDNPAIASIEAKKEQDHTEKEQNQADNVFQGRVESDNHAIVLIEEPIQAEKNKIM